MVQVMIAESKGDTVIDNAMSQILGGTLTRSPRSTVGRCQVELDLFQQEVLEWLEASLNIANDVGAHQFCR